MCGFDKEPGNASGFVVMYFENQTQERKIFSDGAREV